MGIEILHNESDNKFYTVIDGSEAYLRYIIIDGSTLDFIKTYVPPELRDRGLAGEVVKKGLSFAAENGYKIIPSCSYVATYIQRHKEYEHLLA